MKLCFRVWLLKVDKSLPQILCQIQSGYPLKLHHLVQIWSLLAPKKARWCWTLFQSQGFKTVVVSRYFLILINPDYIVEVLYSAMTVVIFSTLDASVTAFSFIIEDFTAFGMNPDLKYVPQMVDHGEDMESFANQVNGIKHWDLVFCLSYKWHWLFTMKQLFASLWDEWSFCIEMSRWQMSHEVRQTMLVKIGFFSLWIPDLTGRSILDRLRHTVNTTGCEVSACTEWK